MHKFLQWNTVLTTMIRHYFQIVRYYTGDQLNWYTGENQNTELKNDHLLGSIMIDCDWWPRSSPLSRGYITLTAVHFLSLKGSNCWFAECFIFTCRNMFFVFYIPWYILISFGKNQLSPLEFIFKIKYWKKIQICFAYNNYVFPIYKF